MPCLSLRTGIGFSHVFPFRASKIYRSSQRKSRDSQPPKKGDDLPAASLIRPQTVNESFTHSQLVAKRVSPRRLFLFTSANNANICNHSRIPGMVNFPKCVTMTIEFSQAGGLRRRRPEKGSMARLKEAWVNAHYRIFARRLLPLRLEMNGESVV